MTPQVNDDLRKSGLVPEDMFVRDLDSPERAMTNINAGVDGYVIPYFTFEGKMLPHYRVRQFNALPKYKQPKDTPNHVYFPKLLQTILATTNYIVITEGEKKAAIAVKRGFPCIALGGVDCWINRSLSLPSTAELTNNANGLKAYIPSGTEVSEDLNNSLAIGIQDLIDHVIKHKKHVIFCYDSDSTTGTKPQVQRAMAAFAFELRFRGIPFEKIRQAVLPPIATQPEGKVGLDEYLTAPDGTKAFAGLISDTLNKRSAFPRHPVIREFINRRLQKSKPNRKEVQQVSMAILSDLDANGIRLRSAQESQTFYFDFNNRKLLRANFNRRDQHDDAFGQFLYRAYGLSTADDRTTEWLAAQFTGEDPVSDVTPHRVLARSRAADDSVTYQLSDSQYAVISADGLEILDNGEHGILFESEQVEPLDTARLLEEYDRQLSEAPTTVNPLWCEVLSTVRLRDQDKQRHITALLYYMSPWLNRWRGTQLPVEMYVGEPGSGKSSLCELRLTIINGKPQLRNAPTDLKDWHASISNSGGLHVTDNVQLVDRNLRQRLSDELCRIVTEPNPAIEMRKYYTEADLVKIPIKSVFALTSIQQPFQNPDIIQRSIITDFEKLERDEYGDPLPVEYDSAWCKNQVEIYGGREAWIAHHFVVLQRFFQAVVLKWNPQYKAKHRLINVEQSMMLMAEVLGLEANWIPSFLSDMSDSAITKADWVFEGIKGFVDANAPYYINKPFYAGTICDWCSSQDDFQKNEILSNPRRLTHYLGTHKSMVASIIGLVEDKAKGNKSTYKIVHNQKERRSAKIVPIQKGAQKISRTDQKKDHKKDVERSF